MKELSEREIWLADGPYLEEIVARFEQLDARINGLVEAINTALAAGYDAPEVWQGLRDALKEGDDDTGQV